MDSIVYFIDGGPPLKRAKKSKSKAWNPTCIAGTKQIAWSRVVKYLTRTSPHHPTLGWPRTIHFWLVFESQNGPVMASAHFVTVDPVFPHPFHGTDSLGVRTPNLDNCHLDSAWPLRPATDPDIQWFKPLQPHVLPLKKDICYKVCSQHLPGVEIWQIKRSNYPFPLLVAIMYKRLEQPCM